MTLERTSGVIEMTSAYKGKVAHVLRKYDPSEWGGTETHVVEVTRRLGLHGWPSEVHAPRGPSSVDTALASNVPLVRYRAHLPFIASRARRRALRANAGNIVSFEEVVRLARDDSVRLAHLHTSGRIGGAVRAAMRWTKRPYVMSIHGPMLANREWLANDTARRLERTIDVGQPIGVLLGARRVLDDAARVITFNEEERRALAERVGARAIRMDHGVDTERLGAGDAQRGRTRWSFVGQAPCVVLVGRVCAQKNQLLAVRAFARGAPADYRLILAGAATDLGYREQVEQEARSLGVADRVHLLGNLNPRSEVPDLFAMATLVIVPSTHEAFGLAVLEGWAAQRCVLFARHSGLEELAGAINAEDEARASLEVEDWSTSIAHFLSDPEHCRKSAQAGMRAVQTRFNWDVVASKLSSLYDEVVSEGT